MSRLNRVIRVAVYLCIGVLCTSATVVLPGLVRLGGQQQISAANRYEHWSAVGSDTYFMTRHMLGGAPPAFGPPDEQLAALLAETYTSEGADFMVHYAKGTRSAIWIATFRGLPWRCAWAWESERENVRSFGGWMFEGRDFSVPIRPVWWGLVGDVMVWFVGAALVHFGVPRVWRWLISYSRRRRGLCGKCGYSRGGLDGAAACPECGAVGAKARA